MATNVLSDVQIRKIKAKFQERFKGSHLIITGDWSLSAVSSKELDDIEEGLDEILKEFGYGATIKYSIPKILGVKTYFLEMRNVQFQKRILHEVRYG